MPITSPVTIWSLALSETANPNFWAEKICNATWRNAWTHSSGASASARGRAASHGATYQTAIMMKMTKFRTLAIAAADVSVMKLSESLTERAILSVSEPVEGVLTLREPGGRKDRRTLECLFPARLDRVRETRGHVKCELPRTCRAIARDDAVVAPLHHARAELVAKLRGVDQQERRPQPFRLPGKQGESRLEPPVC